MGLLSRRLFEEKVLYKPSIERLLPYTEDFEQVCYREKTFRTFSIGEYNFLYLL